MDRKRLQPEPLSNGANGRRPNGKFARGNKAAVGRSAPGTTAAWRSALAEAVTQDDVASVLRAMVRAGCRGDVGAAKIVLAYTLGRPIERVEVGPPECWTPDPAYL